jgi:ABC-2 type transport system permease protein
VTSLTGTGALTRLALRQDRVRIPAWAVGITVFVVATAASFDQLYPTAAQRAAFAATVAGNTAFRALYGPALGLSTTGGLTAWRTAGSAALLAGLMSLLLAVRHTRAEEEAGRAELLGAAVVGRHASIAAALAVVGVANLAVVVLVAAGLVAVGQPAGGSAALGLAIGLAGCVFGALAAVCAQVASTGRAAAGAAGAALGLAFVLRAAGDVGGGTLSWLSPIGWAQRARAFAGERWAVLGLPLLASAALAAAAVALASRRDHGAGLLPARAGPAASPRLGGPWGLAWRLQRGVLAGWTAGFLLVGAVVGAVARDIQSVAADSEQFAEILQRMGGAAGLVDAYLAAVVSMLGLVAAGYMIQAVLRVRAEETALRAEPVLATAVSRSSWAGAHLACAAGGTVVVLAAGGLAIGLAHGLRTGEVAGQAGRLLAAGLAQVPAAWVLGGLAFAAAGLLPRLAAVAWVAFAACLAVSQLGELLDLPAWALDLSPFRHTPQLPAVGLTAGPLLLLTAAAAALALLGLAGLRRRDIL